MPRGTTISAPERFTREELDAMWQADRRVTARAAASGSGAAGIAAVSAATHSEARHRSPSWCSSTSSVAYLRLRRDLAASARAERDHVNVSDDALRRLPWRPGDQQVRHAGCG